MLLNNLGDISTIKYDEIEDFDMLNFSFSCTDLSNAGKQSGMKNEDGTPTRSGLYIYGIKAIRSKKPKYIMIENVKGLISKKFVDNFYSIIDELKEIGYNCYYPTKGGKIGEQIPTCLNAKDFGIPQNRERVFVICVRDDVDDGTFEFPIGSDKGLRLKDVLEKEVEEKYYLRKDIQDRFKFTYEPSSKLEVDINKLSKDSPTVCEQRTDEGIRFFKDDVCGTLRTIDGCGDKRVIENSKIKSVGQVSNEGSQCGKVYSTEGLFPTVCAGTHGYSMGNILDNEIKNGAIRGRYNDDGKIEQRLELRQDGLINTLTTVEKDNVVIETDKLIKLQDGYQGNRVYSTEGLSPTITAGENGGGKRPGGLFYGGYKIRKLTPLECWRLMGFPDENFYKAKELGISDSGLYKQAGNSIVVNCLYYIFENLFKQYILENEELKN